MKSKKIILFFSSLDNGGGRTFAISLAKQITNFQIYLCSIHSKVKTKELAESLDIDVTTILSPKILLNKNIIIVSNSQITAIIGSILFPGRHIYVTHGFANGLSYLPIIRRALWFIQINIPGTKLIGCGNSEFNKIRSLTNRFSELFLINNSIPLNIISSGVAVKRSSKVENSLKLCYIGRICYQKGLDILIDALENFSIPYELTVIGDNQSSEFEFCKNIQNKILNLNNKIIILKSQKITAELLNKFDLCIAPSRFEGLPYLLLELAYYGMPLMVSDCPGNSDVIPGDKYGFIFSSSNVDSLVKSLHEFNSTTNNEIDLRIAFLRERIIKNYNPKEFRDGYERLFNE